MIFGDEDDEYAVDDGVLMFWSQMSKLMFKQRRNDSYFWEYTYNIKKDHPAILTDILEQNVHNV